ncbi:hypothetical protein FCI23_14110 [Actinacidiphila oryziradicis]|uniref:Treble clef zinc finger domain-containing protein n=2 Tax=Actinacidiphila oryziradicis TaxID=2571141 RepID=A0A4U0T8M5_9ACTN|nr:hypothetical protein FCI23_14110 [Actinacidiphila oryziradicis]
MWISHGCGRRTSPARASVRRPDRAEEGGRGALGVSLVEAYPQVAAMWLQERNGGLTPQKATPKMQVAVWWRCAAGHEWEERISNRTAMPKWRTAMSPPAASASTTGSPTPSPCAGTRRGCGRSRPSGRKRRSRQAARSV